MVHEMKSLIDFSGSEASTKDWRDDHPSIRFVPTPASSVGGPHHESSGTMLSTQPSDIQLANPLSPSARKAVNGSSTMLSYQPSSMTSTTISSSGLRIAPLVQARKRNATKTKPPTLPNFSFGYPVSASSEHRSSALSAPQPASPPSAFVAATPIKSNMQRTEVKSQNSQDILYVSNVPTNQPAVTMNSSIPSEKSAFVSEKHAVIVDKTPTVPSTPVVTTVTSVTTPVSHKIEHQDTRDVAPTMSRQEMPKQEIQRQDIFAQESPRQEPPREDISSQEALRSDLPKQETFRPVTKEEMNNPDMSKQESPRQKVSNRPSTPPQLMETVTTSVTPSGVRNKYSVATTTTTTPTRSVRSNQVASTPNTGKRSKSKPLTPGRDRIAQSRLLTPSNDRISQSRSMTPGKDRQSPGKSTRSHTSSSRKVKSHSEAETIPVLQQKNTPASVGLSWRSDPTRSFSDWTVEVIRVETNRKQVYHCHSNVLAWGPRHSELFIQLFQKRLQDRSPASQINLSEKEADVFPLLLDYMYCENNVPLSAERACALYVLAQKFKLPALEDAIQNYIEKMMSLSEMIDFIANSDEEENEKTEKLLFVANSKLCGFLVQHPTAAAEVPPNVLIRVLEKRWQCIRVLRLDEPDLYSGEWELKRSRLLSKVIAECTKAHEDQLDRKLFDRLTHKKHLPAIDLDASFALLAVDAAIEPIDMSKRKTRGRLSSLQERCLLTLSSNWLMVKKNFASLDEMSVALSRLNPAVLADLLVITSTKYEQELADSQEKLIQLRGGAERKVNSFQFGKVATGKNADEAIYCGHE